MKVDIEKDEKTRNDTSAKKKDVPLEEALNATGTGKYSLLLILTGGITHFAADCGVQIMSVIMPVASCDLQLTSPQKGILSSMGLTGMLTSAHLCGVLADVYGRRKVLLVSLFLQGIICILSSFAPDAISLMICWFIYGNAAAGVLTPVLVYINEFCPESIRTKAMIVIIGFGALAEAYLPSVAWLIIPLDVSFELFGGLVYNSWRLCLALLSIPIFLSMFFLARFPESPKFILNQGKIEETMEILQNIYAMNNNTKKEDYPISSVCLDLEDKQARMDGESKSFWKFLKSMLNQTALLFNKTFIGYTLLSSLVLLGIGATYMVTLLWVPDQASHILRYSSTHNTSATVCEIIPFYIGSSNESNHNCTVNNNLFLVIIALGLLQAASFIVTSLIADKIGKKLLLSILLITPGLLCIVIIYIKSDYLVITAIALLPIISSGAFPIALTIVLRYFPTSIRSNAASVTMSIGRIGISVLNLLFGILMESFCEGGYWMLSAAFIGSALLCIMLPSRRKL